MKEQLLKAWNNIRDFWKKLSKKSKILIGSLTGGVLVLAIAATVFLNVSSGQYKILYPGIDSKESAEVYATLQEMSVSAQMNPNGEIMVPAETWDDIIFELAGKGYPKTAPAYGVFLDNTGFTTTEFEKKQALIFQLQDRIQETLSRIEGVDGMPVVTITVPEDSAYVWQESKEESTAGVLIGMRSGYSLSPERVSAIRNLVASSVPKMKPENVKVIDQKTGEEMIAEESSIQQSGVDFKRLEYEREIEKDIEAKVERLLAPRYGSGVTAVAEVTLDYDKTKLESRALDPEDDGLGVETHFEEKYTLNGNVPAQGIVGEENNTDVPQYPSQINNEGTDTTNYQRSIDYDIGYSLTQVEKGQAVIKDASIAVVVNDSDFTTERQDILIDLIAKGVNIDKNKISVTNLDFTEAPAKPVDTQPDEPEINPVILFAICGGVLLLLIIILTVVLLFRRKAKQKKEQEQESETVIRDLQQEIEQHRRELMESAQANNSKENAITNEIREFAKENPEITASLIRSMLKEDE